MHTLVKPKVTVLMSIYNGVQYLNDSLKSIQTQAFDEFEIVVIDDASDDDTPNLLERAAKLDPRIVFLRLDCNHGLAGALNRGLEISRGEYIARMDVDDISKPERLSRQFQYLEANKLTILAGSSIDYIDQDGNFLRSASRARDDAAVRWLLRFQPAVPHPTFMFRAKTATGERMQYNPSYRVAQDYDFVVRALEHGRVVCLPDRLLQYRLHKNSVSHQKFAEQASVAERIATDYQRQHLSPQMFKEISPIRESLFQLAFADALRRKKILESAKNMLAADILVSPERKQWLCRQTAQLAVWAMRRGRATSADIVRSLLFSGASLVLPAVLRFLETQDMIPGRLCSHPNV